MMQIISHRGYWKIPDEKNKAVAFARSFDLGYGTETDLRDHCEHIVISHDMPSGHEISLEELFTVVKSYPTSLPLALNIKADGLAKTLKALLAKHQITNYFVFDMSIPDLIQCLREELHCYTRVSEYESEPLFYDHPHVVGIWLDAFKGQWYNADLIRRFLNDGKSVALVSPDLHQRLDEFEPYLAWLKEERLVDEPQLMLCTDFPEKATELLFKRDTND